MQRHHRDSCFLAVGKQGQRRRLQISRTKQRRVFLRKCIYYFTNALHGKGKIASWVLHLVV